MMLDNFVGIQYEYGQANDERCDCWGLIQLWYERKGLDLDIDTKEFYQKYQSHDKISLLGVWRLKGNKLKEVKRLTDNAILVGVGGKYVGFGVWIRDREKVLMIATNGFSRLISWSEWYNMFDATRILIQPVS
jgi:NlpC/P60 family